MEQPKSDGSIEKTIRRLASRGPAETEAAGRWLSGLLRPGDLVVCRGELGAGKTVFTRGLAHGLGCDPDMVCSPTFALAQEYRGGTLNLLHVDAYRLPDGADPDELGVYEYLERGWAAVVEWSERLLGLSPDFTVTLRQTGPDARSITIEGRGIC